MDGGVQSPGGEPTVSGSPTGPPLAMTQELSVTLGGPRLLPVPKTLACCEGRAEKQHGGATCCPRDFTSALTKEDSPRVE